jgi:20S proteasome subunit alpha 5
MWSRAAPAHGNDALPPYALASAGCGSASSLLHQRSFLAAPHQNGTLTSPPYPPIPSPHPQLGSCAVGVKTAEGVVLAAEKRITSPLIENSSVEKIFEVDRHIGAATSGLMPDARTLIDHARVECQSHRFTYDEPLRVESVTQSVCDLALSFGEGGEENKSKMSRPFGVSLLLAGVDGRGPQLFHTDPSGTFVQYEAHAIGQGSEGAVSVLQEKYNKSMTLAQAQALVTRVLADVMEEKLTSTNFEMVTVTPGEGYRVVPAATLQPLIDRAHAEMAAEA